MTSDAPQALATIRHTRPIGPKYNNKIIYS